MYVLRDACKLVGSWHLICSFQGLLIVAQIVLTGDGVLIQCHLVKRLTSDKLDVESMQSDVADLINRTTCFCNAAGMSETLQAKLAW